MKPNDLSVGAMAKRAGVAVSTLHYYEAEGLISSWRTEANHRRYDRRELRRVAIIRIAQGLGIPLAEIWWLGDLAAFFAETGRNRCLLTAPPLRLPGAVGSPATPVATV